MRPIGRFPPSSLVARQGHVERHGGRDPVEGTQLPPQDRAELFDGDVLAGNCDRGHDAPLISGLADPAPRAPATS
jgi:hypothetical protein